MLGKNKKGTIGATLTWVIATILIFVIVILFLIASGVFGIEGVIFSEEVDSSLFLEQQQSLFAIGQNLKIRNAITQGNYDEFKKEVLPILEKIGQKFDKGPSRGWEITVYKDSKNFFDKLEGYSSEGIIPKYSGSFAHFIFVFEGNNQEYKLHLAEVNY